VDVAVRRLARSPVASLLVEEPAGTAATPTTPASFFSFTSVCYWLASRASEPTASPLDSSLQDSLESAELRSATVAEVAATAGALEVSPSLPQTANCADVLLALVAERSHRVVVRSTSDGSVLGVVSQSRILALVAAVRELVPRRSEPVSSLGLVSSPVISVRSDASIAVALKAMAGAAVSGVAVVKPPSPDRVSPSDRLVGSFTATALRRAFGTSLIDVALVHEPLADHASFSLSELRAQCLTLSASLDDAIALLSSSRLHRAFLVEEADGGRLLGVLTLSDVTAFLVRESGSAW
jgi:CBS domain-containing protein